MTYTEQHIAEAKRRLDGLMYVVPQCIVEALAEALASPAWEPPVSKAFLLKIGTGASPPTFTTVAGLRVQRMEITARPDGGSNISLTGNGVFTGEMAEHRVEANALSGTIDDYQILFEDGMVFVGRFLITRLDFAGDFHGERTYTVSLESAGRAAERAGR
jgi:predicted secreted protein